jgi:hypothetical protein
MAVRLVESFKNKRCDNDLYYSIFEHKRHTFEKRTVDINSSGDIAKTTNVSFQPFAKPI